MNPEKRTECNEVRCAIDEVLCQFSSFLEDEPRMRRPLIEARDAAKTKYEDAGVRD